MIRSCVLLVACVLVSTGVAIAQPAYTTSSVFAHNDYVGPKPFYAAYDLRVGYIEADVFLHKGELMVAHTRKEIQDGHTLEVMYTAPLADMTDANGGFIYPDANLTLTLMIDLKTAGPPTLDALVKQINTYQELLASPGLYFTISGNVPSPDTWSRYPEFITFDGRPGIEYTDEQLTRVRLISDNFHNYSNWSGQGALPETDKQKLQTVIQATHAKGKPIRFWATPDTPEAWTELMKLGVDVINTDKVSEVIEFIGNSANR